jgi:hypothetical protein
MKDFLLKVVSSAGESSININFYNGFTVYIDAGKKRFAYLGKEGN